MKLTYLLIVAAATGFISCHTHGHGHDHDSGAQAEERMEWWGFTDNHEVFIDAAVPQPGEPAAFFIHFTQLADFQPARGVSARMEFKTPAGVQRVKAVAVQPGIWRVDWEPASADSAELILWWATSEADGQIPLGTSTGSGWSQPDEAVNFGREQVWAVPFATAPVARDTVWSSLVVPGKWMAAPGDDRSVSAGASGTLRWGEGVPVAGAPVRRGEVIARIDVGDLAGAGLAAEAATAEAEWEAAESAVRRLKPLREAGVVTASEWESALARQTVATEAWNRLQGIRANQAWEVRSPIDGYVRAVSATTGAFVTAESPLCTLTTDREQWVEIRLSPDHRSRLATAHAVRVNTPNGWIAGHIAAVANQIDSGLLNAYVALDEVVPGSRPLAGSFAEVQIEYGSGDKWALAIPTSALLEQYGQFEVAVQVAGEQFELRPVQIGARNALQTEVIAGLEEGDRVVSKGAFAVRMASLKGSTPAHGHTH